MPLVVQVVAQLVAQAVGKHASNSLHKNEPWKGKRDNIEMQVQLLHLQICLHNTNIIALKCLLCPGTQENMFIKIKM